MRWASLTGKALVRTRESSACCTLPGRRGWKLGTIKRKEPSLLSSQSTSGSSYLNMDSQKKDGKRKAIEVGPWGGNGGSSWDDGTFSGVREITIVYERCIDSIRVEYDKHGKPISGEKHGGNGGSYTAKIKLQYPEEFLTSISGYYCSVVSGGGIVIRSLTFKSNRRTFGPYGVEEGIPFTFAMEGGLIAGFKGRSGWYLDSIGFRLSRLQGSSIRGVMQRKLKKLGSLIGYNNDESLSHSKAT
ncbi:hypothetical protein AAC387_Pa02g0906 [Persea americana]